MVSAWDFEMSGPGFHGWDHCMHVLCSWVRHSVPLSIQFYHWEMANLILWVGGGAKPCNGLAFYPRGSRNTLLVTLDAEVFLPT